ncbi:MAG: hypothetical protein ACI4UV_20130, partial [Victivallales bacterium]
KTCGTFTKDSSVTIHHIQGVAEIPADFGKVASASFEPGKVTFTDKNGKSAAAPVNWEFLNIR